MKALLFFILPCLAIADCTSPAGITGQLQWITATGNVEWCDGANWVDPIVTPGTSCVGETQGLVKYDSGDLRFCDGSFWQSMKGLTMDSCIGVAAGTFQWDSARFAMKYCDGVSWYAMFDSTEPNITTLGVNSGSSITTSNNVLMNLAANVSDGVSKITHFCLKYSTTATAPTAPAATNSCWVPVNYPSPGIQPANSISFSGYYFSIGFSPSTYYIYAWVKSGVDQISEVTNSGAGTLGTDYTSIIFEPGQAPILSNVFATNSDSPSIPPIASDLVIPEDDHVYIKWHVTDDDPLPADTIDIYYTTNEVDFFLIQSGLPNSAGSGCTVDGVSSTGCYKWVGGSPTSGYFSLRIKATDATEYSSVLSAEPNNMGLFKMLAGTTDPGLGSSAVNAVLFTNQSSAPYLTGSGSFVVRDNGMMILSDDRGLMMVDPSDGNYKLLMPYTGVRTDGALASATLVARPIKIALDYQDRLLIYDNNRIRRLDFTTGQVTSLIGGGGSVSSGVLATDFSLSPTIAGSSATLFTPLPNGDLWFQTYPDFHVSSRSAGTKIRIYKASDQRVYTLVPTGTGSLEDAAFDPSGYELRNFGIAFNPITSAVTHVRSRAIIPTPGGYNPRSTSYDPVTGVSTTPHVPYLSYWADDSTITSRNGEMYAVDRFTVNGVYKYNSVTNVWDRIVGTGVKGQCPDGTAALSCDIEATDAFINSQNQLFFIDRNRIRTIDGSGNVVTYYGQALTYGDGGFAASARVNDVWWLDQTAGGKIVFIDNKEFVMREFTPEGTITKLAGTGTDSIPNTTATAVSQALSVNYWGGSFPMVADATDGTVYYTRGGGVLSKLDRSTGKWVDIAGGGGTSFTTADGLLGNQISFNGYNTGPMGYTGSSLLRHSYTWSGTQAENAYLKTYAVSDGTQSALAGQSGVVGDMENCADGTALSACPLITNHNYLSRAHWDATNSRWLVHQVDTTRIRTMAAGGNYGTFVTLPRGFKAFTYVVKATVPYVYYCSAGRMYKYNLNTSTETTLFWPSSTISCQGFSLVWHPTRQSIIFAIKQNGLGAIAEIYDP
jgi:hypothetical protein